MRGETSTVRFCFSVMLGLLLSVLIGTAFAQESLESMTQDPNQWVMTGRDYALTRYSPLKQITTENVKDLKVAWTMSTGTLRGHEGNPLVIGDMMYFESAYPNFVYAINLSEPGRIVWKFAPRQDTFAPSVACCDLVNRGVAYGDGKIIANTLDGHVYALDAKTGRVVWAAQNAEPKLGQTMTNAPLVVRDKVIVGVSGGEYGVRCYVTAYDLGSGRRIWRAYSEGPDADLIFDPEKTIDGATQRPVGRNSSLKTWRGEAWKLGGGGTWGWYSYDPKLNLFYYGSGNPGTWNPTQRPGDNKWSMTIFARNPDTGEARWVYQMTPHDGWDYDGVNEMILADLDVNGSTVPTLVHFDRNGFAYVLNRENGKLIAAHKYDPTVNWAREVNLETGRPIVNAAYMTKQDVNVKGICPSAQGDKDQQPVAFDPETKLFYAPLNHLCMDYQGFAVKYKAGFPFVGAIVNMYPAEGGNRGRFIAFDPISGQAKWEIKDMFQDWGGALVTAGGLAFYGTLDGWFRAVDKNTGKILYQFKCPSGIIGNPMTFMHNGKQYVAILSGVGGWSAIGLAEGLTEPTAGLGAVGLTANLKDYTTLGGTLLVFSL
jgi:PQQ-dependent dehydrogenase (methanol/ethanol family)